MRLQHADRIRERGIDDYGNPLVVLPVDDAGGAPPRCCLRDAIGGERVALIAHRPAAISGAYAEIGPVFIHAEACSGYADRDAYPAGFRHRQQLLRAYDGDGWQVDNQITDGRDAETVIDDLFSRPEVAFLHSRNLLAGCFMFSITRPGDRG